MFRHWKTSLVGILLAAAQAAQMALQEEKTGVVSIALAVFTAALGVIAKDKEN